MGGAVPRAVHGAAVARHPCAPFPGAVQAGHRPVPHRRCAPLRALRLRELGFRASVIPSRPGDQDQWSVRERRRTCKDRIRRRGRCTLIDCLRIPVAFLGALPSYHAALRHAQRLCGKVAMRQGCECRARLILCLGVLRASSGAPCRRPPPAGWLCLRVLLRSGEVVKRGAHRRAGGPVLAAEGQERHGGGGAAERRPHILRARLPGVHRAVSPPSSCSRCARLRDCWLPGNPRVCLRVCRGACAHEAVRPIMSLAVLKCQLAAILKCQLAAILVCQLAGVQGFHRIPRCSAFAPICC